MYEFRKEDFGHENPTFIIWDVQRNKFHKNINNNAFVICEDLENNLEEQNNIRVINASIFEKISTNINTESYWREVIILDLPNATTLQEYLQKETIEIKHTPFSNDIYISDEENIIGPFRSTKKNDNNFTITTKEDITNCYNLPINEDNLRTISFVQNEKLVSISLININALPKEFKKIDCINDMHLKELFGARIEDYYRRQKSNSDINSLKTVARMLPTRFHLSDERTKRINSFIKNGDDINRTVQMIYVNGFTSFPDSIKEQILTTILSNENLKNELYKFARERKDYKNKIDELIGIYGSIEELQKLKKELESTKEKIKPYESINIIQDKEKENKIKKLESDLNLLRKENTTLRNDLDNAKNEQQYPEHIKKILEKSKDTYNLYADLRNNYQELEKEKTEIEKNIKILQTNIKLKVEQREKFEEDLEKRKKELQNSIGNFIDVMPEYYGRFAFDGELSSRMLQAAAKYEREKRDQTSKDNANLKQPDKTIDGRPDELVTYIQHSLSEYAHRNISVNDIANIVLCIAHGFLTILVGEPGTGKTSLVSHLAEILGYANKQYPRYTEIAVEKGWTSKRDLIGYYNPLTKSFDATNDGLFSALAILHEEYNQKVEKFPYWVLLDEANLSQMEHYWADFMALCDLDKKTRQVTLSDEYIYDIPKTLRFIATMNLDHTTETISPRLIDRAWIIRLNAQDINLSDVQNLSNFEYAGTVTYSTFDQLTSDEFCNPALISEEVIHRFDQIKDLYRDRQNIVFSPRVIKMISRYCASASRIMDTSKNPYTALDYAIAQKILPMINGFGEEYADFIDRLETICSEPEMPISNRILKNIKIKGDSNMQYYQFFHR